MDALISIKPRFVQQILAGNKQVEIRRSNLVLPIGTRLWIYATSPTARIEALATVSFIDEGAPQELWRRVGPLAGISLNEYNSYIEGAERAFAIHLDCVQRLRHAPNLAFLRSELGRFHPPQFFKKLEQRGDLLSLLEQQLTATPVAEI